MADQATAEAPQAAPEAPVGASASTTADVTSWAKAEAQKLEAAPVSETPTAPAPDSSTPPATPTENEAGAAAPDDQSQEGETPKLSRKERDEQRRAEIRTEERTRLENEFKATQDAERTARERQEAEQSLLTLITRAEAGDYQAARELAAITRGQVIEGPKQTAREATVYQAGRNAILADMAKDFEPAVRAIEGVTDEDFKSLASAPSSGEYAKRAISIGQKLGDAKWESKVATLEAENTSLKGQLAARGPSPLSANGSNGHGAHPAGTDMKSIAAQVAAELGMAF